MITVCKFADEILLFLSQDEILSYFLPTEYQIALTDFKETCKWIRLIIHMFVALLGAA